MLYDNLVQRQSPPSPARGLIGHHLLVLIAASKPYNPDPQTVLSVAQQEHFNIYLMVSAMFKHLFIDQDITNGPSPASQQSGDFSTAYLLLLMKE